MSLLLSFSVLLFACGEPAGSTTRGPAAAVVLDSGAGDSGMADSGALDSGATDSGLGSDTAQQAPCPDGMALVVVEGRAAVCMDQFEAPNTSGALPLVMYSLDEAGAWCGARGSASGVVCRSEAGGCVP